MMGQKIFTPKQLYRFSLEDRVPADHLLRQVAAVVDFSFVRRLTARFYSHTGKPSIDPVVLFKMALIGYLYGITSERRLADELRLNLAFMWFIGYDLDEMPPDHSVLSKARRRFGLTVYQAFFTEIVRQCALLEQLATVDEHVAALWRDNPDPQDKDQPEAETPSWAPDPQGGAPPPERAVVPAPGRPPDAALLCKDRTCASPAILRTVRKGALTTWS
jgi:transposase